MSQNKKYLSLSGILLVGLIFIALAFNNYIKYELAPKEEEKVIETTTTKQDVVPSEITLYDEEGQTFHIPISSIPDLEKYLTDTADIKTELERIQSEYLDWGKLNNHYFILKYGCGNKLCDLVLVQINEDNEVKTIYLANGSFVDSKVFEEKAMLLIALNEGSEVARHQIVIIDLNDMKKVLPLEKNDEESYFTSPIYPITEFRWASQNTIELAIADVADTSYETLERWYKDSSLHVKEVKILIE